METQPTWVKIAQNAAIGEARSRSFLLDRFWILERSIDIHGADFIIQRRLTSKNILDRNAPKLGVVQAKFISSISTAHYINCEYVIDKELSPRDEYFLFIHTGNEDNPEMFFLTAQEIVTDFNKVKHDGVDKYQIPGRIIRNERFQVKSRREVLDRIEEQLTKADFAKNREYLSWTLSSIEVSIDDILPDYNLPIDNDWGDISEGFCEAKMNAAKALIEVENVCFILKSIATEIDPNKTIDYLSDFRYHCRGGINWYIPLPDNIYDEEFIKVVQRHQEIIRIMKKNNRLDNYLRLLKEIETNIIEYLYSKLPFEAKATHKFYIEFDVENWKIVSIVNTMIEESFNNRNVMDRVHISGNVLEYEWKPLSIIYGAKRFNENSDKLINNCKYVSMECMRNLMNRYLGTDY